MDSNVDVEEEEEDSDDDDEDYRKSKYYNDTSDMWASLAEEEAEFEKILKLKNDKIITNKEFKRIIYM